ncbi:hypothetical protein [Undibacterium rugosum]|uniref:Uncharacterized protein n=1 Tax=Undibacterium rugosum TaxID=2762291 RepID=A0A923KSX2_9BURK|nr:hypothetical protein [Undibacterium rugosum]MBC3935404.1 hypothetical protein [Undibacterium rugosum]MBR7778821.1 hypothetical protein [Undibacterium rugosum]
MTLPAVIEAQSLILAGDIAGAEFALANIAETHGDKALVAALDDLPAKDLLAVIREYDASKESLVNLVVTPEQFAQAVVLERRYGDQTHEQLRGMINSVIFRDGADPAEFLYEIAEVDGGYDALVDYLLDRTQMVEHFYKYATFDLYEYGDGERTAAREDDLMNLDHDNEGLASPLDMANLEDHDWMQVTYILRYELPEIFREVLMKLRARYKVYLANLQSDDPEAAAAEGEPEEAPKNNDDGDDDDDEESAL